MMCIVKCFHFKYRYKSKGFKRAQENRNGYGVLEARDRDFVSCYDLMGEVQHIAVFINFMCLVTFYVNISFFFYGYITRKTNLFDGSYLRQDVKKGMLYNSSLKLPQQTPNSTDC